MSIQRGVYCGGILAFVFCIGVGATRASSGGITSYSGQFGVSCNACHGGGVQPTTTISGPTTVTPGSVNLYTLTIAVPASPTGQRAGGLDVSADGGLLGAIDPGTRLESGEITQNIARSMNAMRNVVFQFNWEAPAASGTYTLFGAGNAVNLTQGVNGDAADTDTLSITVAGAAATPGESSAEVLDPLLVTGFDETTGDISISFETACETTSNNLYSGPLSQVSTYDYTGEDCDIGTSGTHTPFNPGSGSYFFVVVGTKDGDEGSYGTNLLVGGAENERPDSLINVCGQIQVLSDRCD